MNPAALTRLALAAVVLAGCSSSSPSPPAAKTAPAADDAAVPVALDAAPVAPTVAAGLIEEAPWLDGAERVAVVPGPDPVIAVAGPGWLRLLTARGRPRGVTRAIGSAQVLEVFDADGDGTLDVIEGRGRGRGALQAPMTLAIYRSARLGRRETVPLPASDRAEIVSVAPDPTAPGALFVAAYESKYMVRFLRATRQKNGTWTTEDRGSARVVSEMAVADVDGDGTPEVFMARPYGDTPEQPGEVALLGRRAEEGGRLPVVGGARSVRVARDKVIYSDGWHREYGRKARGLITRARRAGDTWEATVIAEVPGRWSYDELRLGDLEGDGLTEIIAAGNGPAVAVPLRGSGAAAVRLLGDREVYAIYPADLDRDGADEVLMIGPKPGEPQASRGWIWRRIGD